MRRLAAALGLAAVAASAGYLLGAERGPPPAAAPRALDTARVVERAPVVVAGGGVSEADLRRVVKEELAAAAPAADKPPPAPPQPADPHAYDAGMQHVQHAIAQQQRWTQQDAFALDRELEGMSPDQRAGVLRRLVLAINHGDLKLNDHALPY